MNLKHGLLSLFGSGDDFNVPDFPCLIFNENSCCSSGNFYHSPKTSFMKKITGTILIIIMTFAAYGQQEAHFTQFVFNKLIYNPAYAGSKDVASMSVLARQQWIGMEGAPSTQTFGFHTPLLNKKLGLGFSVIRDQIGVTSDMSVNLAYAYRIKFNKQNVLSVGLQSSFRNLQVDWNSTSPTQIGDGAIPNGTPSTFKADIGFGAYFSNNHFFAGFSAPFLMEGEAGIIPNLADGALNFPDGKRHYFVTIGGVFDIGGPSQQLKLQPSLLVKYVDNAPIDIDFNAFLVFRETFWVGLTYRMQDSIDGVIQIQLSPTMRLGAAYDFTLTDLQKFNYGTLEMMLEYNFSAKKDKMLNPRHFYF